MIKSATGNILIAAVEALVNPVNCVGVMGKGLALQFKKYFPENFTTYWQACSRKELRPGTVHVHRRVVDGPDVSPWPRYIVNFPTKRHWSDKSRLEDIESGLAAMLVSTDRLLIRSVAIPKLGCGLGGLDWQEVRPLVIAAFDKRDMLVLLYEN